MNGDKLAEADKALKELALIPMSCSLATWGRLCGAIQDGLALAVHSAQGVSNDAADAAKWRALIGSARIRVLGSAGLHGERDPNDQPYDGYAHIGLELWTRHEFDHEPPDAVDLLERYVAIAAAPTKETP